MIRKPRHIYSTKRYGEESVLPRAWMCAHHNHRCNCSLFVVSRPGRRTAALYPDCHQDLLQPNYIIQWYLVPCVARRPRHAVSKTGERKTIVTPCPQSLHLGIWPSQPLSISWPWLWNNPRPGIKPLWSLLQIVNRCERNVSGQIVLRGPEF